MKIYLIRHGNHNHDTYQNEIGDLNKIGIEQANKAGKFLVTINPELIITSTYERTIQTALEINKYLKIDILRSNLFTEIKLPTSLLGKNELHEEAIGVNKALIENFHTPDWHHSDEENFEDVKNRAANALDELSRMQKKKVLVVSHAGFIKRFVSVFAFGQEISSEDYKKFMSVYKIANCGITELNIEQDDKRSVITWNSISHLDKLITY